MLTVPTIDDFLHSSRMPFSLLTHRPAFTAQQDAAAVHVSGRDWAKVVVCVVDGTAVEAVVSACQTVNLARLLDLAGGSTIRVASERELTEYFPDCEVGAMPPLGHLYGIPVYVDVELALESSIVFDGGTHTDAIRMRWADFAAAVRPIVGPIAEPLNRYHGLRH